MKAKLKPIEVEYLQWNDNLSEMKMFCKDNCKITYEYAVGIDCYWNLLIISNQQKWLTVPLHSYVVKLPDRFIVMDEVEFKKYFNNVGSEG